MTLSRRDALALGAALPLAAGAQPARKTDRKLFRMAFQVAETGFDPVRLSDLYSRIITGHIFEALYGYDPLARPATIVPRIAVDMPEVSS
ncbi:MAG: bicyclomycin resistance protein, partial [Inhella sp.]